MNGTLAPLLLVIGLSLASASQGAEGAQADVAHAPPLEMERSQTANERTIARLNGWNINVSPTTSLAGLKAHGKQYVVVSYGEESALAQRLRADARTVLMREDASLLGRGLAVLAVDHPSEVEEYAALADEGPSAACGSFQLLSLDAPVTAEVALQDPFYDPGTKLAAVTEVVVQAKTDQYATHQNALVSLGSRCHTSANAALATAKVEELFQAAGANIAGFAVTQIAHTRTNQKSVVATIPGSSDEAATVIIGGHLDSIVRGGCASEAPGADDDASGIAAITEVIRSISELGLKFHRTVEFHGYAAEEAGLIGSGEIARSYKAAGRRVIAQMQWDMVGYGADDALTLVTSNTSSTLTRYVKDMAYNYVGGNSQNILAQALPAGASSDHASWTQQGFPAVFPFERLPPNANIHSVHDTMATATNTALASRAIKLGIAYLAHMAGLVDPTIADGGPSAPSSDDLKIAIIAGQEAGAYYVAVAGAAKFQTLEICKVPAGSQYCVNDLRALPYLGAKGERHFYMDAATPIKMAASESWRAQAYDESNQLVARRDFTISVK